MDDHGVVKEVSIGGKLKFTTDPQEDVVIRDTMKYNYSFKKNRLYLNDNF